MKSLLGGSESKSRPNPELQAAVMENLGRATNVAELGYMPFSGPEVAAMPQGILDLVNRNAEAMGSAGVENVMPTPADYGGGLLAHSSKGLFDDAVDRFRQERPGQAAAYDSLFIDPYADPTQNAPAAPQAPQVPAMNDRRWAQNPHPAPWHQCSER